MAEALTKAGVRRIYGVVGDSLNGFTDALRRRKSIDWIHMRHEEAAAFAAGAEAHLNVREDHLDGLAVGQTVNVARDGANGAIKSVITELQPLGVFATWQAERVIGDHDRNTLRMRLDPVGEAAALEPGMTVWIEH